MLFGAGLERFRAAEEKDFEERFRAAEEKDFEDTSGCHIKIYPKKPSKDTSGRQVEIYNKKPSEDTRGLNLESKDFDLRKSPPEPRVVRPPGMLPFGRPPGMPAFGDGSSSGKPGTWKFCPNSFRTVSSSGKPGPSKPSPNSVPFRHYGPPQGKHKASGSQN